MNLLDAAYALTIWPHYCWHRLATGKYGPRTREKTGRLPARLKTSATAAPDTADRHCGPPCLWLHAVSVGEAVASVDLVRMFMRDNPQWELRVSTTTATGRAVCEKHFGAENVVYYPLDFSGMVSRAFDNIRPAMVVLMELEIWPNFLAEAVRRKVPVAVANARITERSVRRLAWVPRIAKNMALAVEMWFSQTGEYAARLEQIGVPPNRIEITGSVKYDAVPLEIDAAQGRYYRRLFGCDEKYHGEGGPALIVAGSTHPTEERILLEALRKAVPEGTPEPRVVLAPRHPERLNEVEAAAGEFGKVERRSRLPEPIPSGAAAVDADIILVDTMGELSKIYAAADIVFVGGTLIRHGGQNFIEPCGLARPTVVGPNLWNFAEPAELLGNSGCMRIVRTPDELPAALEELMANPAAAAAMGARARKELLGRRGAARRMVDRLNVMARSLERSSRYGRKE